MIPNMWYILSVRIVSHALNILNRKRVFKLKQHFIHTNLAIALLLGLVVFVSGIETASEYRVRACVCTMHS